MGMPSIQAASVAMAHSEKVPKPMQEQFESLCQATDAFSEANLNDEYKQLIRYLLAALCRKRPSPVERGKVNTWAAAVVHAIGTANFLFDKTQIPHCKAPEIYAFFGVSASNSQAKSKLVRDLMGVHCFSAQWTLPSRMDRNPMVWMVEVDGFIHDARNMPLSIQEIAYEKGLIPYIPALKQSISESDHSTERMAIEPSEPQDPSPSQQAPRSKNKAPQPSSDPDQLGLF